MALVGCGDDGTSQPDAGAPDAGAPDAGLPDAGDDGGGGDGGLPDGGLPDGGTGDGGLADAGAGDAGVCPSAQEVWEDLDLTQFTALPALEDLGSQGAFTLAKPATYWELRRGRPDGNFTVLFSVGDKCNEAESPQVCRNEFDDMTASMGFGGSCLPGQCFGYIAVNRENTNSLIIMPEELIAFLGTIDSPAEAALIAFAHGHYWAASDLSAGSARLSKQGFEILVTELVDDCDPIVTDRVQALVSADGALTVMRRQTYSVSCGACI